ncbi:fructosamine kinase family protein [Pasteurellaceae bacterium HPA106]|uniref:fructosamine kinase family protein n=1 Tax=Spirabiliibacterium pneumoniae TaxID=221400 RepID=UPI001AAE03BD|nr:fructosamine kinase family protein [Spirabiliibacterium pneumoniae]MBE2896465.1 fructosamine kinase family protein [Spirabiliibacterium pneumoniae]
MWKAISQLLADQLGAYYSIKTKEAVQDGEQHHAWVIDDGTLPVFVKANDRTFRATFRAEADQLEALAATKTVRVPRVYGVGCSENSSFIVMEYLPLSPISAKNQKALGRKLAQLHSHSTTDSYGFDYDTWLGPVYQPNAWRKNWSTFFAENRIGWQLQLCKEQGIHFGNFENIISAVSFHLAKHQPKPALLHGAFYAKNRGVSDDDIVLFDPACYWGDHECDLALNALFESDLDAFYQGYSDICPIDQGYAYRQTIYQLYYLLNFSHRFGGDYIERAMENIELIS